MEMTTQTMLSMSHDGEKLEDTQPNADTIFIHGTCIMHLIIVSLFFLFLFFWKVVSSELKMLIAYLVVNFNPS